MLHPKEPTRRPLPALPVILLLLLFLLWGGAAFPERAAAAAPAPSESDALGPDALARIGADRTINLDFNNVDITALIKFFSEITGRNFLVDQRVTGKITAFSPTPISVDEAYQVFLNIMEMNGFRVIKSGNLYRIMPDADARAAAPIKGGGDLRPLAAELVTRVIPLRQASAVELGKSLPELLGGQGAVTVYAPSNTLIVTTSAGLMEKVLAVVQEVDQGLNRPSFRSFSLRHANARTAAQQIDRMMQARSRRGEQDGQAQSSFAVIVGDERTGRIVVVADPESMSIVERSIASFDLPTTPGKGDMRAIALKFASAEDLATVITNLVGSSGLGGSSSSSSSSSSESTGQAERVLVSDVRVVADKASNSLLVAASPRDFDTIRELVTQVDVERRQVYVEAMVVEASTEVTRAMGINWYAGGASGIGGTDYLFFGGSRPSNAGLGAQTLGNTTLVTPPSGGSFGVISAPISFAGMDFTNLNILANFMDSDNRFKILATPQLMTLDNEEASVVVAENIPFLTQSSVGTNSDDRTVQTVDYRDVGITLNILPQVSMNGKINLKVQQIVSRVTSTGIVSDGQVLAMPTTRRREVNTRVVLEDGQTLVIAGLISKETSNETNKVPGLGDIPAFGWLFKSQEKGQSDTNLLLFITPKVVKTREEAMALEAAKRQILFRITTGDDGRLTAARMPIRTLPPRLEQAR